MALRATRRAVLLLISLMTIAFFTIRLRSGRPVYLGVVPAAHTPTQKAAEERYEQSGHGGYDADDAGPPGQIAGRGHNPVDQVGDALGHPGGQEAAEDRGRQGEDQNDYKRPDQHHRPVATPVETREAASDVSAEEESQEDQDPKQSEARYDRGPDLPARKIRRDAEGDEHEPGDGREDRPENDGEDEPEKARQPVDTPVHVPEPVLTLLRSLEVTPRVGCRVPGLVRVARRPDNAGLLVLGRPLGHPSGLGGRSLLSTRPDLARGLGAVLGGHTARLIVLISKRSRSAAFFAALFRPVAHLSPLHHIVGRPSVVQCRFYPANVRGTREAEPAQPYRMTPGPIFIHQAKNRAGSRCLACTRGHMQRVQTLHIMAGDAGESQPWDLVKNECPRRQAWRRLTGRACCGRQRRTTYSSSGCGSLTSSGRSRASRSRSRNWKMPLTGAWASTGLRSQATRTSRSPT